MINYHRRSVVSIADIYVILYFLYKFSEMYINTSMAAMITLLPMLAIAIYYFAKTILYANNTRYVNALIAFSLLLIVYGTVGWMFGQHHYHVKPISFLLSTLTSIVPVTVFYYLGITGRLSAKQLRLYFFLFLFLSILQYFHYFSMRDIEIVSGVASERTNNAGYHFLSLFPLLLLFNKRPFIQYVLMAIMLYFIMSAMKRGAILISVFLLVWFFYQTVKDRSSRKWLTVIVILCFAVVLFHLVQSVWMTNDYFHARMEATMEGDDNNRSLIYSSLWNYFIHHSNIFKVLFGVGAEGTVIVTNGLHAHNDWFELLIDCGLLGVSLYAYYFICFYIESRKPNARTLQSQLLTACFIILFLRTFFSMSFMDMDLSIGVALGYGAALSKIELHNYCCR